MREMSTYRNEMNEDKISICAKCNTTYIADPSRRDRLCLNCRTHLSYNLNTMNYPGK